MSAGLCVRTLTYTEKEAKIMAEGTKVSVLKKGLDYLKTNKKPLAIGGGGGLVIGSLVTLAVDKLKGKKGKK